MADLNSKRGQKDGLRDLLRKRRNVYGFTGSPIANKTLRTILEDSMHVPSAGFTQDCDVVVVSDAEVKKRLAEAAYETEYAKVGHSREGFISKAPVVVVPCANKARFEAKYGAPGERNARLPWWLIDSGFASLALILSAFERGLAASFIGAFDDERVVKILNLPSDGSIVPLALIPIGHGSRRESAEWRAKSVGVIRSRRRRFNDYVHWDGW